MHGALKSQILYSWILLLPFKTPSSHNMFTLGDAAQWVRSFICYVFYYFWQTSRQNTKCFCPNAKMSYQEPYAKIWGFRFRPHWLRVAARETSGLVQGMSQYLWYVTTGKIILCDFYWQHWDSSLYTGQTRPELPCFACNPLFWLLSSWSSVKQTPMQPMSMETHHCIMPASGAKTKWLRFVCPLVAVGLLCIYMDSPSC